MKKRLARNEKGWTLIETLISVALLGLIGVAFLGALSSASKAMFVGDERATAESLARTEMEYIKSVSYVPTSVLSPWSYELPSSPPSWDVSHALPSGYEGYAVYVTATVLPSHTSDDGIQKIQITVKHNGESIITSGGYTLEGYKYQL